MLLAMGPYHRLLTRRSSLALLQGMVTFNAYSAFAARCRALPHCSVPHWR